MSRRPLLEALERFDDMWARTLLLSKACGYFIQHRVELPELRTSRLGTSRACVSISVDTTVTIETHGFIYDAPFTGRIGP
jgi:hypothetical protein